MQCVWLLISYTIAKPTIQSTIQSGDSTIWSSAPTTKFHSWNWSNSTIRNNSETKLQPVSVVPNIDKNDKTVSMIPNNDK